MIVIVSRLLSRFPFAVAERRRRERASGGDAMCALSPRPRVLIPLVLVSVGLAGCAGSLARDVIDASNRPGGLLTVVPCPYNPDISGALRTAVTGSEKRKKCDAVWTHPTASQEQLVEDMTACSKAAFWVVSPSAAQGQRLACMESKGYRRDTERSAVQPTSAPVTAKVDDGNATSTSSTAPASATAVTTAAAPPVSTTTPAPIRPSAKPGELTWPPVGSSYVMTERTSGSFGSGQRVRTIKYLGVRYWQGRTAFAFSDGSATTYVDGRRRMLARINDRDGNLIESFDPYLIFAEWPLAVGKWWPNRYRYYDGMTGRTIPDVSYDGKVEGFEDIKTPAGHFTAFRIELGGASSSTTIWYSSDLGIVIKSRSERRANHYLGRGVIENELMSYDFKP
jgi:hypothetical protein